MSDHYVKVKVQLEQMKSCGEDAEKQGVEAEEQLPVSSSSPPASVSAAEPPSITVHGGDATNSYGTHRGKSRSKQGKDDKNSCGKPVSDLSLQGSVVSAHVRKNLNGLGQERTLHIRGTGKILQGKSEPNGNYMTIHASKIIQDTRREDGFKLAKKRRPVTVDTSKAKTSLEALKLSIKQLKWKEVCFVFLFFLFFFLSCSFFSTMCCADFILVQQHQQPPGF